MDGAVPRHLSCANRKRPESDVRPAKVKLSLIKTSTISSNHHGLLNEKRTINLADGASLLRARLRGGAAGGQLDHRRLLGLGLAIRRLLRQPQRLQALGLGGVGRE